jgi:hypothetical protein
LLLLVSYIKSIKVLPPNIMPIRRRIHRIQISCLLNDLHKLGISRQLKRKAMAMDEVCYCNIHTIGSIWVNRIATNLHLGDNTTLGFLWVKEQALSNASRSATANTGTLVDRPRSFEVRKSRQIICLAPKLVLRNS